MAVSFAKINNELQTSANIDQLLTIGYRPQANGIVERENGEIVRNLTAIVQNSRATDRWSDALPLVQRIVNLRKHSSTECSAIQLLYGGMVSLNRGMLGGYRTPQSLEVSYVKELYDYQLSALCASQIHFSVMITLLDNFKSYLKVLENHVTSLHSVGGALGWW